MKILNAVNAAVGIEIPDVNITEKAIIDLGLEANAEYTHGNDDAGKLLKKTVDQAAIAVLMALKILAKVDQGGFGLTFSLKGANENIRYLCGKWDLDDPTLDEATDTITSIGDRW